MGTGGALSRETWIHTITLPWEMYMTLGKSPNGNFLGLSLLICRMGYFLTRWG